MFYAADPLRQKPSQETFHLVAVLVVLEATVVVHETVHFLYLFVLQLSLTHPPQES